MKTKKSNAGRKPVPDKKVQVSLYVLSSQIEKLGEGLALVEQNFKLKQMSNRNTKLDLVQKPSFCQTPVISRFSISDILDLIKEQTGLELELCDYFTGIKEHNGRKYFNVILSQRTSESKEYDKLKRFADKYKLILVEPNGLKRAAVLQNGL